MARKTHYEVLGMPRDASSVDIAAAFREKLAALQADPEADPEAYADVRDAYQVLANPARRAEYDAELPLQPGARRAAPKIELPDNTSREDPGEAWWHSKPFAFALPVVLVVLVLIGWRGRHKDDVPPPRAVIAATVAPPRAAEPAAADDAVKEDAQPASPAAGAVAAAPPKTAEEIFANASAGVVRVSAFDRAGRALQQGSGVVIRPGQVITNCHVTQGGARFEVKSGDRVRPGHLGVADEALDLCTLNVPGLEAPALKLGSFDRVRVGQRVYAIGAPMGLELALSEGIVSSLRDSELAPGALIQTTAAVSPGSSGGGLFDAQGELIGIVTFDARPGQNLNFALPVEWLGEMRARSIAVAQTEAAAPLSTAQKVVGRWRCFAALSGLASQFDFRANGKAAVAESGSTKTVTVAYEVGGDSIRYAIDGAGRDLRIESIAGDHMILFVSEGNRLACERA